VATTGRKPPTCSVKGCEISGDFWAPVWGTYWSSDGEELIEGWGERPFCDQHHEEAFAQARRRRLDDLFGPLPRMRSWTLDSFPADDPAGAGAKARARQWQEDESYPWLYIFGPVGSGKSGLALALLRADVERSPWNDVRFVNVRQLLAGLRRSYEAGSEADPTKGLAEAWLVCLDDVGAERPTGWARETLATLIEARYVADLPTIVTTNYAPSELAKRLGHDDPVEGLRIVSRLTEGAVQIRLDRPDLRQRVA
jgi:DNA replication protein DnaC